MANLAIKFSVPQRRHQAQGLGFKCDIPEIRNSYSMPLLYDKKGTSLFPFVTKNKTVRLDNVEDGATCIISENCIKNFKIVIGEDINPTKL